MNHLLCDLSSDSFVTFVNQDMLEDQDQVSDQCELTEKPDISFSPDSPNLSKNSGSSPPPLLSSHNGEPSLLSTHDLVNPDLLSHDMVADNWGRFYNMGLPNYGAPSTPINFLSSDCQSLEYFNFTNALSSAMSHPLMLEDTSYANQLHTSPFYGSGLPTSSSADSSRSFSPKEPSKKKTREKKSATTSSATPYSGRSYFPPPPVANIAPKPPSAPEIYIPNFSYKTPSATPETMYTPTPPQQPPTPAPARSEPDPARAQVLNKRQERLIKNRAAAFLSRKRKREQMLSLESTNEQLLQLNQQYKNRIAQLENQLLCLGAIPIPDNQSGHAVDMNESASLVPKPEPEQRKLKPINTVFMIMFFSLVFFSLPPNTLNPSFNQLSSQNEVPGQVLSSVSVPSHSRQQSFQSRPSSPKKELLALPEVDSRLIAKPEKKSHEVRAITRTSGHKQEMCMRELFDWLDRGLAHAHAYAPSNATESQRTDLVPASSTTDTAYVFTSDLRTYLSPQRFRSPNPSARPASSSSPPSTPPSTSSPHPSSPYPKFSLLSPWVEEPGSKSHDRLMKLEVQVLGLSVIDSNPLL